MLKKALAYVVILIIVLSLTAALALPSPDVKITAFPGYFESYPILKDSLITLLRDISIEFPGVPPRSLSVRDLSVGLQNRILELPGTSLDMHLDEAIRIINNRLTQVSKWEEVRPIMLVASTSETLPAISTASVLEQDEVITLKGVTVKYPLDVNIVVLAVYTDENGNVSKDENGELNAFPLPCELDENGYPRITLPAGMRETFVLLIFSDYEMEEGS